ncbi:hypothetical protein ACJX0J_014534 [Zea mays]
MLILHIYVIHVSSVFSLSWFIAVATDKWHGICYVILEEYEDFYSQILVPGQTTLHWSVVDATNLYGGATHPQNNYFCQPQNFGRNVILHIILILSPQRRRLSPFWIGVLATSILLDRIMTAILQMLNVNDTII